ncbi:hypothetical protein CEP53_006462 [Fusarium sp. AF-6]|nr:hypothetical protein CEP53_006462 [Fusarium sp. AF-6]
MCRKLTIVTSCSKCWFLMNTKFEDEICDQAKGKLGGCKFGIQTDRIEYNSVCDPCFQKGKKKREKDRDNCVLS